MTDLDRRNLAPEVHVDQEPAESLLLVACGLVVVAFACVAGWLARHLVR